MATETKTEKLEKVLEELKNIGEVGGSIIASRDGLKIASDAGKIDEDVFAAMAAAMQGAAETAASELRQGEVEQIVIETEKGKIISTGAGKKAILIIRASKGVNLGLALLEMGKAAEKISEILR